MRIPWVVWASAGHVRYLGNTYLSQVTLAPRSARFLALPDKVGKDHSQKDRNDPDHNHGFDKRESPLSLPHRLPLPLTTVAKEADVPPVKICRSARQRLDQAVILRPAPFGIKAGIGQTGRCTAEKGCDILVVGGDR